MSIEFIFGFCVLVIAACSVAIILRQQQTIERLTEKLMAKDYAEYKRFARAVEPKEKPQRKPMSFYDDPGIGGDDD